MPLKNHIVFPVPCAYCGTLLERHEHTFDHITPRFLGGTSAPENLAHCCYSCNAAKAAKALQDFLAENPHLTAPAPALRPAAKPAKPKRAPAVHLSKKAAHAFVGAAICGEVALGCIENGAYTPPRGAGVSQSLRQALNARGISIKWLPLISG